MPTEPEFFRLRLLPPYVFAEVNAMKAKARAAARTLLIWGWAIPTNRPPSISSTS